jgi:hypothetical protein
MVLGISNLNIYFSIALSSLLVCSWTRLYLERQRCHRGGCSTCRWFEARRNVVAWRRCSAVFLVYSRGPRCWFLFQIIVILRGPWINHEYTCILQWGPHTDWGLEASQYLIFIFNFILWKIWTYIARLFRGKNDINDEWIFRNISGSIVEHMENASWHWPLPIIFMHAKTL